ncbi:GAF domain-containing protein [Candidatus Sumerlaeota bacterium]|nr:GAF domain-containing protein [Candidatus Sumerlaeota bacterium]
MAHLFLTYKDGSSSRFDIGDAATVTVGREIGNSVVLADPHVSRRHFRIVREQDHYLLRNLSRTHGTLLNGVKTERAQLGEGDEIEAGSTRIRFSLDVHSPSSETPGERPAVWEDPLSQTVILSSDQIESSDFFATTDIDKATFSAAFESAMLGGSGSQELRKRFTLLQDIGQQMVTQLRLDRLLVFFLDTIFEVLRADNGAILLADPVGGELVPMAVRRSGTLKGTQERLRISRTLIQQAFQERVGILCGDTQRDEQLRQQESILAFGMRSVMCVPLMHQGNVLGAIHVDTETASKAFSKQDLDLLTMMANQAAVCVHNARLHDQIVREETRRANLERHFSPQIVEKISSNQIRLEAGVSVEVAVLFSDIRAFTQLSEQVSPENLFAFLNRYFSEMSDIVFEFGGTLDKFMGDALLAVFGSPESHPDDTYSAARCAEKMIRRTREIVFDVGAVSIGIGLHRGNVIHGEVGSEKVMQYTVIGDTVNIASRLCDIAAPNQIVMSTEMVRALENRIESRPLGLVELKGKADPIETYELFRCLRD